MSSSWLSRLALGMPVYAVDGPVGTITSIPRVDLDDPTAPARVILVANQDTAGPGVEEFLQITHDMVERIDNQGVYLSLRRAEVPPASAAVAATQRLRGEGAGEGLRIPAYEEQVGYRTRVVNLGHVRIQKKVDQLVDERELALRHQEVEVERVPVDEIVPELIEPYMDGDVYVIPVIEEEIVVERRLRLKELMRVRRTVAEHSEMVRTPYRRERIVVEEHWADGRDQTTEDAEPASQG
jgi:stress response protein YsnF